MVLRAQDLRRFITMVPFINGDIIMESVSHWSISLAPTDFGTLHTSKKFLDVT